MILAVQDQLDKVRNADL